jgi:RimJ/RimL family protein N-acetyltransferase|tara:strand:- start:648 stop:1175 length:528 start_codon:yes stop_codon:yes gene_type:complete
MNDDYLIKLDSFELRMINSNHIEQICYKTHKTDKIGAFFTTKVQHKQHWLNKLKNNELWNHENGGYLAMTKNEIVFGIIWHFKHGYQRSLEIGMNIFDEDHRGQGLGQQALIEYSNYLFSTYPIHRLQYNMVENNVSSEKIAIKAGFKYEGTMKKVMFIRGEFHDLKLYSKLKIQ